MGVVVVKVLRKVSDERKIFIGTAFFINKTTLVTARHVIQYAGDNDIYLRELPDGGDLLIPKDSITICNERDVAFFKTVREFRIEQVQISNEQIDLGSEVEIKGYYKIDEGVKVYKHHVSALSNAQYTFELQGHLTEGLSGSPVFVNNKIVGIAQAISRDKNITYIIPISECCCDPEMELLDNSLLKKLVNEALGNNIEVLQRIAYSVLPKEHNQILPNTVSEIIDVVGNSEDSNRPNNIPILCLAKILNSKIQSDELSKWIEHTKVTKLADGEELNCISNKLDNFYHILIEVLISSQNISNSSILVWEDKIFKEGVISYQNVILKEGIDLKSSVDIASFLDELMLFLNKFSNPNNLLLEFILPKKLLEEDISLWPTTQANTLASKYRLIYRFQERMVNYADYATSWKANWQETYENDNKLQTLGATSSIVEVEEDKQKINRTTKSLITGFPISEVDISRKIYEFGTSVIISPSNKLTEEELKLFNEWFREAFKDVKIEEVVEKINDFCLNN